jgi:1-acyl-sn-glycerol-3-phosphate acyltransferase
MIRTIMVLTFVALALLFVQPLLILWTLLTGDANFMYKTFMRALRVTLRLAGIHVRVEGAENIPSGVCVFTSNHASNLDPVALVPNIPRRVGLLAKKEVFRIPILSKALLLAKLIPVDRADKEAAAESVDIAVEYLHEGLSFCVFPEGTRSRDGRMLPFKKGTFLMAIRAAAWVVPVSLAGTQRLMRKGDWTIHPGEVVVRYGPAVKATEYAEDQRDELRRRVQELVAASLPEDQKPPAGNG